MRTKALADFARHTAPALARNEELIIADVGCSIGQQTWMAASALRAAGVSHFRIEAFDNQPDRLAQTAGPYDASMEDLAADIKRMPAFPASCIKDFEAVNESQIQPTNALRECNVTFHEHDIIATPLPKGRYHAVIATNILYHYNTLPDKFDAILDHIATGMQPGGLLVHDGSTYTMDAFHHRQLYRSRATGLAHANSVLRYYPHRYNGTLSRLAIAAYDRLLGAVGKETWDHHSTPKQR